MHIVPKLLRRLGRPAGMKSRFVGLDGEQCTVEEFALQHYATEEHGCWKGAPSCSDGGYAWAAGILSCACRICFLA